MDLASVREARTAWDRIAASFDSTRRATWPPVTRFIQSLPAGGTLLDAGVGNGRHAEAALQGGLRVVGVDVSRGLLRIARRRAAGCSTVEGIVEELPFRSHSFDAAICVAAMHHVRGRVNRLLAWRELARVLRPGAPLLVTVWAQDQPRFRRRPPSPPPRSAPAIEPGDAELRWRHHGMDQPRFVHLYDGDELAREAREANLLVDCSWNAAMEGDGPPANHLVLARTPGVATSQSETL